MLVCSPGPVLACLIWFCSKRREKMISFGAVAYSVVYGAVGCAISILLIENLVRVLCEVTGIGYLQVGVQGRTTMLFLPPILFFAFLEEALKVLGVTRLVSRSRRSENVEAIVWGLLSGTGFSSSITLVRTTILLTKKGFGEGILSPFLQSLSHLAVHSGTTGLLSLFLTQVILGEKPIISLLKAYLSVVLVQVAYELIPSLNMVYGVNSEVWQLAFAALFSVSFAVLIRRQESQMQST